MPTHESCSRCQCLDFRIVVGGVPCQILKLAKNQRITIFASQKILADIEDTLERPKLQSRKQYWEYTTEYLMAVTGDLDLLTLHNFENIPIITPKEFLSRYFS